MSESGEGNNPGQTAGEAEPQEAPNSEQAAATDVAAAPGAEMDEAREPADGDADGDSEDAGDDEGQDAAAGEQLPAQAGGEAGAEAEDPDARRVRLKSAIEALIFVSDRVITPIQLGKITKVKGPELREILDELILDYSERGIQLVEVSGGFQFRSSPTCSRYVQTLVAAKPVRLTRAQLETLALVAYRQPITRPEVDEVRGVDTGSAIKVLLERGLIKMLGRKDEAGRPMLYGTTPYFLEFFGLKTLRDLPTLKEFTDLSEENRILFKRKTGEEVETAQAELEAEEEVAEAGEEAAAEAEAGQLDDGEPKPDVDGEGGDAATDAEEDGDDIDDPEADPDGPAPPTGASDGSETDGPVPVATDPDGDGAPVPSVEPDSDGARHAQDPEMSGE